ncbi:MAG: hypothetical protein K6C99_07990 [Lachnospiraceae bacterium]|nr:hypothetical protein [Lachnospiraceae bacterium]
MDYQNFVDSICETACILSVKMLPDSDEKIIAVSACNSAFEEIINSIPGCANKSFVPDSPYENYFPKNSSMDEQTIQAAILKVPASQFTSFGESDVWVNLTWIPLNDDEEEPDTFYCCLILDLSGIAQPELAFGTSNGLSNTLLEICNKMNYTTNMIDAVRGLLSDITDICNTEVRFCVLSKDSVNEKAMIITVEGQSDVIDATFAQSMGKTLYQVAEDWIKDFGNDDCIQIRSQADFDKYKEIDPSWVESLVNFSVAGLVMLPLIFRKEIIGFIWASIYEGSDAEKEDMNLMKEIIEKVAFAVANVIANYQQIQTVEELE